MLEVTLEGPRGSGKTLFAQIIKAAAEEKGYKVYLSDDNEATGKTHLSILMEAK